MAVTSGGRRRRTWTPLMMRPSMVLVVRITSAVVGVTAQESTVKNTVRKCFVGTVNLRWCFLSETCLELVGRIIVCAVEG